VRGGVAANAPIVNGLGGELGIRKIVRYGGEVPLGGRPVLFHERDAGEAQFQISLEFLSGEIPFQPPTFLPVWVHYENGRRPDRVEAVEVSGIFLDVHP